jgi:hypothetical protein
MKTKFTFLIVAFFFLAVLLKAQMQPGMIQYKHFCGSSAMINELHGSSVSSYKNKVILGAQNHNKDKNNNTLANVGCAFIFEETSPNVWVETKLSPPDGQAYDNFGYSVAINDSFAVVGAPNQDYHFSSPVIPSSYVNSMGAAYVFKKVSVGNWAYLNKLSGWAGLVSSSDNFGASVSIDDNKTIVVGAPYFNYDHTGVTNVPGAGAVFVWQYTTTPFPHFTNQIPSHHITAPMRQANSGFGISVDLYNTELVVGSEGYPFTSASVASSSLSNAGAAYVFNKNGSSVWQATDFLHNNFGPYREGASFGRSVALYDSVIVVGIPFQTGTPSNTLSNQGAAMVFKKNNMGIYNSINMLISPNPVGNAYFGGSVDVYNKQIVVAGSYGKTITGPIQSGICVLYKENALGNFQQQNWSIGYAPSISAATDNFGRSVSIYKNRFIGTSPGLDLTPALTSSVDIGGAFMFCGTATIITQPTNKIICEGASTQFSVNTFFGETFQWQVSTNNGGTWSNISNNSIYSGANTAKLQLNNVPLSYNNNWYQCLVSNECSAAPFASNVGVLFVDAGPNITFTMSTTNFCTTSGNFTLNAYSVWGGNYSGPGLSGNVFSPAAAGIGTHSLSFSSTNLSTSCSQTVAQVVNVSICSAMDESVKQAHIALSPNPADHRLSIADGNTGYEEINIYDVWGRLVLSEHKEVEEKLVEIGHLKNGCYVVEIKARDMVLKSRFIVSHQN